jgi:hypothetical protein
MPRKQRFKPTRKPQNQNPATSNQQIDDRRDGHGDQREIGTQSPANQNPSKSAENDGSK